MFYVYKIEWSVTDSDYVVFFCNDNNPANYLKTHYPKARYYHFVCSTDKIENYKSLYYNAENKGLNIQF